MARPIIDPCKPRRDLTPRNRLPGNWFSTENALEGLAFVIKDAILVVDAFAQSTYRNDADRQHRTAERLIRSNRR